jgi:serine/threonine protein kinase
MDCPPLKKLQSWLDDRCDLDDAELKHVQRCAKCIQFLEQTSQSFGLEIPSAQLANDSFHEEAEFLALQGRLRELSKETLEEIAADEGQDFQSSGLNHDKVDVDLASDASVDLKSLQAALPEQRYALIRILGRGGCGLVVLAFDTKLNREVAIKFLVHDSELNKQRLSREGRILAELDHPSVVRIFDMGEFTNALESRKTLYLVMEFVEGGSAAAFPWRAETSYLELASMLSGVARGLHLAHAKGLVHRDLKPGNLLIDVEKKLLKVADFGLAKHIGESSTQVTQAGNLVGTPEFMSPEQIVGTIGDDNDTANRGVSPSSDIYSLGATLYALLTEQPPFSGNSLAVLRQIPEVRPVAPSILNPSVPRSLELICLHAMEKIPSRRYASMQEFADDLQRFVDGRPVQARTPSWWQVSVDWCLRNKALAGTLILLLCSLIAGVVGTTWMWLQASQNANESASFASSLQDNRKRLRESVSRFQQRIFAEEAMHWQMTEEFRREMFTDVIKYLDEFSELLNESNIDLPELEQLAGDYLMISKAAREVGRYEDAMLAADRAVNLVSQHQAYNNQKNASSWLYLEYRAASAACRARIPMQSFLDINSKTSLKLGNRSVANSAAVDAGQFASCCQRLVQQAQQQNGMAETIDVSTATEDQFRWEFAKRDSVLLSLAAEAEPSSEKVQGAIATFEQCLNELQRVEPVIPSERRLILGEIGWELAWHATSRPLEGEEKRLLEGSELLVSKMRDQLRSLERQLTNTDWLLGITLSRKALLMCQTDSIEEVCKIAQLASSSIDRALEMRPQNRKWIDESVRIELLYCDWLMQAGDSEKAQTVLTNLIKKKLRLSKSAPNDYQQRKHIIQLFVKLADLSRTLGNQVRAREEYYVAAQDCRLVLMNPEDQQWVLDVRPWLLSQVIEMDSDRKFRDGPLALESIFVTRLENMGLDGSAFRDVLSEAVIPPRPSELEPRAIMDSLLYH